MPKTVVEKSRPRGERDGAAGLAIVSQQTTLRLARRHPLSKARGVMLGELIGLVVWGVVIWGLVIWRLAPLLFHAMP